MGRRSGRAEGWGRVDTPTLTMTPRKDRSLPSACASLPQNCSSCSHGFTLYCKVVLSVVTLYCIYSKREVNHVGFASGFFLANDVNEAIGHFPGCCFLHVNWLFYNVFLHAPSPRYLHPSPPPSLKPPPASLSPIPPCSLTHWCQKYLGINMWRMRELHDKPFRALGSYNHHLLGTDPLLSPVSLSPLSLSLSLSSLVDRQRQTKPMFFVFLEPGLATAPRCILSFSIQSFECFLPISSVFD